MKQLNTKYSKQRDQFKDTTDLFTSFVFNLMSNSIPIKRLTEDLIKYSRANDNVSYARTLGLLFKVIIDDF